MCCKQDKAFSFQYCASAVLVSGAALRRMETMTFKVATTLFRRLAYRVTTATSRESGATENVTLRPSIRFVRLQHAPELINLHDNVV